MTSEATHDKPNQERDAVRAAFRAAAFDDEPPAEVDSAILAAARHARGRRLHGYLPPLAMAATVVLALGLIVRLAVPPREPAGGADSLDSEPAPRAVDAQATAGNDALSRTEFLRESAPARATAPAADTSASPPATASVPEAAREERSASSQTSQVTATAGNSAAMETMSAPPDDCAAQFAEDPDGWLRCISLLLDAGDEAAARRELEAFTASFPGRAVPDAIAARLTP